MHMDLFVVDDLRKLLEHRQEHSISAFMPAHPVSSHWEEDRIRFKNLIKAAGDKLEENGVQEPEGLLEPMQELLGDREFWQYQADGLAAFRCRDFFVTYRVPLELNERVVVSDRFHVKPLLPLLSGDGKFYILALSQNDLRFFQASRHSIREVELTEVPKSLQEALWADDPEKQLQFHTGTPGGPGARAAVYHGQGVGIDDNKDRIMRFCQIVDSALAKDIPDRDRPLVIAAVDYIIPLYRDVASSFPIMEQGVPGNPEELSAQDLHAQAWAVVQPHFLEVLKERTETYGNLKGTGKASVEMEEIVKAAHHGRIDTLFVAVGRQQWGVFHERTDTVDLHDTEQPGDRDLLDEAAGQTLLNSGRVFAQEPDDVPDGALAAAIFRY